MTYGTEPVVIGTFKIICNEMMFYQYLPVKLRGGHIEVYEDRLNPFCSIINAAAEDFIEEFGITAYNDNYVYLTVKKMYQTKGNSFNRLGYHTDGFMTKDINYVWCDKLPTVFNIAEFHLTQDDVISMREMEDQALSINEKRYPENTLLRLDQYQVHRVEEPEETVLRTFIKVSFSKDKYDLKGNSKNSKLNYSWDMRDRAQERNIPQKNIIT